MLASQASSDASPPCPPCPRSPAPRLLRHQDHLLLPRVLFSRVDDGKVGIVRGHAADIVAVQHTEPRAFRESLWRACVRFVRGPALRVYMQTDRVASMHTGVALPYPDLPRREGVQKVRRGVGQVPRPVQRLFPLDPPGPGGGPVGVGVGVRREGGELREDSGGVSCGASCRWVVGGDAGEKEGVVGTHRCGGRASGSGRGRGGRGGPPGRATCAKAAWRGCTHTCDQVKSVIYEKHREEIRYRVSILSPITGARARRSGRRPPPTKSGRLAPAAPPRRRRAAGRRRRRGARRAEFYGVGWWVW